VRVRGERQHKRLLHRFQLRELLGQLGLYGEPLDLVLPARRVVKFLELFLHVGHDGLAPGEGAFGACRCFEDGILGRLGN